MSTVVAATCWCGTLTETVVLCPDHHRYFRQGKELTAVSAVLSSTWPIPPDFSRANPAVLENARDRGSVVDALFSAYVNGTLTKIPAGTRTDVWNPETGDGLLQKLIPWWDKLGVKAQAQAILADDDTAGTCDLLLARPTIYDLKCTYNVELTHALQLGMYGLLHETMFGVRPTLGIIHVTARFAEPRLISVDSAAMDDAAILREMWRMVQRRTK